MIIIFECEDQYDQRMEIRKRVLFLKNLDSVIERIVKSREIFRFGKKKKEEEDSHQR